MNIRCEGCQARYHLDERLFKDATALRIKCRRCGGYIVVARPGALEAAPADPPPIPAAFEGLEAKDDGAEIGFGQSVAGSTRSHVPGPPPRERRPLRSVPSPAATAGEAGAEPREGGLPFLGNLVLFPSEFKETPSENQPDLPLAPPSEAPPAPPPDTARGGRVSPVYNVSRSVVLDPEKLVENRVVAFFPDAPELEAYRVLRTRILQAAEKRGGTTVMITSALPRDGKTVTAINLAMTFSKTYLQTALLVDCDLRQQRVHEVLGYDSGLGLGDYLTNGCTVADTIVWPGVEKLTLISGGKTVSESSELLGSPAMRALVEEMKGRYPNRYIFFDVPPVLAGADALAFAPLVDHILFVVRAGLTPLPEVQKALRMLPKEKVIGLVLNRQKG